MSACCAILLLHRATAYRQGHRRRTSRAEPHRGRPGRGVCEAKRHVAGSKWCSKICRSIDRARGTDKQPKNAFGCACDWIGIPPLRDWWDRVTLRTFCLNGCLPGKLPQGLCCACIGRATAHLGVFKPARDLLSLAYPYNIYNKRPIKDLQK